MALANTIGNIKGGGITKWYIQTDLANSTTWISLPYLRSAKVNFETLSTKTSTGRNLPYATKMVATAQSLGTYGLTGIVEVLDAMVGVEIDSQLELDNGQVVDTSLINTGTNLSGAGFSWALVSDADRSDAMFLEYRAERIMKYTELPTLLGGAIGAGTAATSRFSAWLTAITHIVPAGISKIESGAGAYTDDHGIIRNGKFRAEALTVMDSFGRNIADGRIKIGFSGDMMQASSTETALLDNVAAIDQDWRLTFASGRICTLDSHLGFDYNFEVGSDREGISFVNIKGEGIVASSAWDGLWT